MQFTYLQAVGHGPVSVVLFLHTRYLFRPVRLFWTAFWSNGPNWPVGGEIDIIEGVNDYTNNQTTIHTSDGCSLPTLSSLQLNIKRVPSWVGVKTGSSRSGTDERGKCDNVGLSAVCPSNEATIHSVVVVVA